MVQQPCCIVSNCICMYIIMYHVGLWEVSDGGGVGMVGLL